MKTGRGTDSQECINSHLHACYARFPSFLLPSSPFLLHSSPRSDKPWRPKSTTLSKSQPQRQSPHLLELTRAFQSAICCASRKQIARWMIAWPIDPPWIIFDSRHYSGILMSLPGARVYSSNLATGTIVTDPISKAESTSHIFRPFLVRFSFTQPFP